jgi:hypothetical protein
MRIVVMAAVVVVCLFRTGAAQPAATCVDDDHHAFLGSKAGEALLDFSRGPLDPLVFALDANGKVTPSPNRPDYRFDARRLVFGRKRTLVCDSQADSTCRAVGPRLRHHLKPLRPEPCVDRPDSFSHCAVPPAAWLSSDRSVVLIGTDGLGAHTAWNLKRDREIVVREAEKTVLSWTIAGGVLIAVQRGPFGPTGDKGFVVDPSGKVLGTVSNGTPIVLSATRAVIVASESSVVDLASGQRVATIALDKSDDIVATARRPPLRGRLEDANLLDPRRGRRAAR